MKYRPYKGAELEVYELLGPLYGQRSASKRWYQTITTWMKTQGFEKGHNEPCVLQNPTTGLVVVLYVDDTGSKKTLSTDPNIGQLVHAIGWKLAVEADRAELVAKNRALADATLNGVRWRSYHGQGRSRVVFEFKHGALGTLVCSVERTSAPAKTP